MKNDVTINDFAKLNGCTLKTVLYYHKMGLLPEARRLENGYRVYGAKEMERMLQIRHLRDLGMDLCHIKELLGEGAERPLQDVLMELRADLIDEESDIQERLARIDELLARDPIASVEDIAGSSAFDDAMELLGEEGRQAYECNMSEMYEQQRRVMSLIESYDWGSDGQSAALGDIKRMFEESPEALEGAMKLRAKMGEIAHLDQDDPRIEELAREAADFAHRAPGLEDVLKRGFQAKPQVSKLHADMTADMVPAALQRFNSLFEQYVSE